jgi:hypothetical protein
VGSGLVFQHLNERRDVEIQDLTPSRGTIVATIVPQGGTNSMARGDNDTEGLMDEDVDDGSAEAAHDLMAESPARGGSRKSGRGARKAGAGTRKMGTVGSRKSSSESRKSAAGSRKKSGAASRKSSASSGKTSGSRKSAKGGARGGTRSSGSRSRGGKKR